MNNAVATKSSFFSFLDHLNFVDDDSSSYEIGISDEGFSYLDLASEKKVKAVSFEERQKRETNASLDGSKRAGGQSNISKMELVEPDEICLDTDLMAILKDIEQRKEKPSFFPWALGMVIILFVGWCFLPEILMLLFGFVFLPGATIFLVNVNSLDHSRKNVKFAYRIEGKGEEAFSRIHRALTQLDQCGQVLLYKGRLHFEDKRYSGGASNFPEFSDVTISLGRPPLLDLDFDVWHLRAFQNDFYFMPDHLLVFQGSQFGGVSYVNLDFDCKFEVIQARDKVKLTQDSNVVGKTWRFVNNDGSPDKRFNNNIEIPELKYGILNLIGAGIDLSLYSSNQSVSDGVPSDFLPMQQLASKPVVKVAERRRAEAIAKRKQKTEKIFQIVLDAMCCMMLADLKASKDERNRVCFLMKKIKAPWNDEEIVNRMRSFVSRAKQDGLEFVMNQTCQGLEVISDVRQQNAIMKCLDSIAAADGEVQEQELEVRSRFASILNGHLTN